MRVNTNLTQIPRTQAVLDRLATTMILELTGAFLNVRRALLAITHDRNHQMQLSHRRRLLLRIRNLPCSIDSQRSCLRVRLVSPNHLPTTSQKSWYSQLALIATTRLALRAKCAQGRTSSQLTLSLHPRAALCCKITCLSCEVAVQARIACFT